MAKKDEKSDAPDVSELGAAALITAPAPRYDETIPGGKYVVGGELRNANGQRIDESGAVLAGEAPVPAALMPDAPVVQ